MNIADARHCLPQCLAYAAYSTEMVANLSLVLLKVPELINSVLRRKLNELTRILLKGTSYEEIDKNIFSYVARFIKRSERFL